MSNLLLVNDALSLIGVLPSSQSANAEDGELALRAANELADEWADDGIAVNWPPQTDLTATCPLVGVELTAFKYHLAIRLCPHFGRELSPTLVALAQGAYQKLQRIQMVNSLAPSTLSVPAAEGGNYGYDITTGGY